MKIIIITTILLLWIPAIKAQDSTKAPTKTEKISTQIDNSQNPSIDKKKNDVFIDKDGDGICDYRAKGMSFEKLKKRNRQGMGDGKGKGNH